MGYNDYTDYTGALAARISELRRRAGMTQEALAEKLGVTFQAVSKWERGQSCPDISLLPSIAEIFGVSIDELFGTEPVREQYGAVEADPEIGHDDYEEDSGDDAPADGEAEEKDGGGSAEPNGAEGTQLEYGLEDGGKDGARREGHQWRRGVFDRREYRAGSEYVPQDDGKLRVLLFRGDRLLEEYDKLLDKIVFEYNGEALDVVSMLSVRCGDVSGSVDAGENVFVTGRIDGDANAGENVSVTGRVDGDANAGGSITCGDVGSDANAGKSITCGGVGGDVNAGVKVACANVGGDVNAGTSVECGDVEGSVDAGGSVTCGGGVGGDVNAGGLVACANVGGDVSSEVSVECGDVEGSVDAGGDVTCGGVGGDIDAEGDVMRK